MEQIQTCHEVVQQEVGRMVRLCAPCPRDDLEQTGWVAALDAMRRYDPARRVPLTAYVRLLVRQQLRGAVARNVAVVHVAAKRAYDARDYQYRVPVEDADAVLPTGPSPEDLVLSAEREVLLEGWRARVREALREEGSDLAESHRRAALAVLVDRRRAAEVAAEATVPVREVYAATSKLRARLRRSPVMARLWAEREEL